jgi:hypothetical protein
VQYIEKIEKRQNPKDSGVFQLEHFYRLTNGMSAINRARFVARAKSR